MDKVVALRMLGKFGNVYCNDNRWRYFVVFYLNDNDFLHRRFCRFIINK